MCSFNKYVIMMLKLTVFKLHVERLHFITIQYELKYEASTALRVSYDMNQDMGIRFLGLNQYINAVQYKG